MNESTDKITALITSTAPPSDADRGWLEMILTSHENDAEYLSALLITPGLQDWASVRILEVLSKQAPNSLAAAMNGVDAKANVAYLLRVIQLLKIARNLTALKLLCGIQGARPWAKKLIEEAIKELERQLFSGAAEEQPESDAAPPARSSKEAETKKVMKRG